QAQLKGHATRILVVVSAVLTIPVFCSIRMLFMHTHEDRSHWVAKVLFVGFFIAYEMFMLHRIREAIRKGTDVGPFTWAGDILVETSLPALGIAALSSSVILPVYRAVANPLVLTFFLFIILSILHLSPPASVLSGCVAAVTYLCASYSVGWPPLLYMHASLQSPERMVFSYALELLVAGAAAGAVAHQIRNHVSASLREAEAKKQVERLKHEDCQIYPAVTTPLRSTDHTRV